MRLTVLGGGGFRTPLILSALRDARGRLSVDEVVLHDVDAERLTVMAAVWAGLVRGHDQDAAFSLRTTTDLRDAVAGTDVVFAAVRVGGAQGRVDDERGAMGLGLLGQETVGAGGLTYAVRTVPVTDEIARTVAELAPRAWIVNFTNPAGLVTEAMRAHHPRVVGICDTPIGLVRRALRAVGREPEAFDRGEVEVDYAGLNHLGWLTGLRVADGDLLPGLVADADAVATLEEARLVGVDRVRSTGALPNEYVYYHLHARRSRAALDRAERTRGEQVRDQQAEFHAAVTALLGSAPDDGRSGPEREAASARLWLDALAERDSTYMAAERDDSGAGERDEDGGTLAGGGYHEVAVDLMCALLGEESHRMILDVPNRGVDGEPLVAGLDTEAVVEVPVLARRDEVVPLPGVTAPAPEDRALMTLLKAGERLATRAARAAADGDTATARDLLWRALAAHPLVDDLEAARLLAVDALPEGLHP